MGDGSQNSFTIVLVSGVPLPAYSPLVDRLWTDCSPPLPGPPAHFPSGTRESGASSIMAVVMKLADRFGGTFD